MIQWDSSKSKNVMDNSCFSERNIGEACSCSFGCLSSPSHVHWRELTTGDFWLWTLPYPRYSIWRDNTFYNVILSSAECRVTSLCAHLLTSDGDRILLCNFSARRNNFPMVLPTVISPIHWCMEKWNRTQTGDLYPFLPFSDKMLKILVLIHSIPVYHFKIISYYYDH